MDLEHTEGYIAIAIRTGSKAWFDCKGGFAYLQLTSLIEAFQEIRI